MNDVTKNNGKLVKSPTAATSVASQPSLRLHFFTINMKALSVSLLLLGFLSGSSLCCFSRSSSTRPPPTPTTPLPPPSPVVEEEISAASSNTVNAWGGGGGIDWSYVAPGGQNSGSNRGTVSRPSSGGSRSPSPSRPNGPQTAPQSVSKADLRGLSRDLVRLDTNSVGTSVIVNPQGKISSSSTGDNAPDNLLTLSSHRALEGPTISALYGLLDNYDPSVTARESDSSQELQEQEAFLSAVVATPVMTRTEEFLTEKGYINRPIKDVLRDIWFTPYTRHRSVLGSSGFEHVFVGEVKDGKVSGFHNWVSFYKEEQEGDLNYLGYSRTADLGHLGSLILLRFDWTDKDKPVGSMFVGISPELEMALYTVCFYTRPGNNCPVEINGYRFNIKTHSQNYKGKQYVGTAYPNI